MGGNLQNWQVAWYVCEGIDCLHHSGDMQHGCTLDLLTFPGLFAIKKNG